METKSSDEINFQSYIVAVKEEKIPWNFFAQLMEDLSNSEKRQKLLISILLKELKYYLEMERRFLRSSNHDENKDNFREKTTVDKDVVTKQMPDVELPVELHNSVDNKSRENELNVVATSENAHDAANDQAILLESKEQKQKSSNINGFGEFLSCDNNCGFKSNEEELKIHTQTCQKNAMEEIQEASKPAQQFENENPSSNLNCDEENQDEIMEEISTNSKNLIENTKLTEISVISVENSVKDVVVDNSSKEIFVDNSLKEVSVDNSLKENFVDNAFKENSVGYSSFKEISVDNSFKCEDCGSKFQLENDLYAHTLNCLKMRCDQCKATYANKMWFDAHPCVKKISNDFLLAKCPKKRESRVNNLRKSKRKQEFTDIIEEKFEKFEEVTQIYIATDDQLMLQKSPTEKPMIRQNLTTPQIDKLVNQFGGIFNCAYFCGFKSSIEGVKIHEKSCQNKVTQDLKAKEISENSQKSPTEKSMISMENPTTPQIEKLVDQFGGIFNCVYFCGFKSSIEGVKIHEKSCQNKVAQDSKANEISENSSIKREKNLTSEKVQFFKSSPPENTNKYQKLVNDQFVGMYRCDPSQTFFKSKEVHDKYCKICLKNMGITVNITKKSPSVVDLVNRKKNPMPEENSKNDNKLSSSPEKQKLVNIRFGGLNRCDYCLMLYKSEEVHVKSCKKIVFGQKHSSIIETIGVSCDNNCGFTSNREGLKIHAKICQENVIEKIQSSKIPLENSIPETDKNTICDKNQVEIIQDDEPLDILEISSHDSESQFHENVHETDFTKKSSENDFTKKNSESDFTEKTNENTVALFEKQLDSNQDIIEDIQIIFEGNSNNNKKEEEEKVTLSNSDADDEKEKKQQKFKSDLAHLFKFLPEQQFPQDSEIKKDIITKEGEIKVVVTDAQKYRTKEDRTYNFECKICKIPFISEEKLNLHVSLDHHSENFKCARCEAVFDEKPLLQRHIWNFHEKGDYTCKFCAKHVKEGKSWPGIAYNGFKNSKTLKHHVMRWHKDEKDCDAYLKCFFCEEFFTQFQKRRGHIQKKHLKMIVYQKFENFTENDIKDQNSICKCLDCSKVFMNKKDLYEHNKDHHSRKCHKCGKIFMLPSYTYRDCGIKSDLPYFLHRHKTICNYTNQLEDDEMVCKYCQQKYTNRTGFLNHIANQHKKSFICSVCGKRFGLSKALQEHNSIVHEGQRNHHCDLCELKFSTSGGLQLHKLKIHKKEKNFQCDTCGKKFFQQGDVNRHVAKFHEKRLDYKCEVCFSGFFTAPELRDHIVRAHENPDNKCQICEKDFNNIRYLREHMINAHDSARPFKCDTCDRSFHVKSDLKIHSNFCENNPDKESRKILECLCDICGRNFKAKVYLKQHYATHTGEKITGKKTEKCNICGASFTRQNNLATHKKTVHRGIKRIKWENKKSSKVDENSKSEEKLN